jgi:ribokinase
MADGSREGRVVVAGSLNLDLVLRVDHLPRPGETVPASSLDESAGGKGLNQAVAAARAGATVRLVGCVGDDPAADALLEVLHRSGVDTAAVRAVVGTPSGSAIVQVDSAGTNSIVVHAGANAAFGPEDLDALGARAGDVVVAQGEIPPDATAAVLLAGRRAGATTVLNLAPSFAASAELLASVDVLVVNLVEATDVLARPLDALDPLEVVAALQALGPSAAVLTLGERGSAAADGSSSWTEPAIAVEPTDTTGAGDALVGVLAAGVAAGQGLREALRAGTAAAALAVQRDGAAPAMPARDEIDALVRATSDRRASPQG